MSNEGTRMLYTNKYELVEGQIRTLQSHLEQHKEQYSQNEENYDYVNDLGRVYASLSNINEFLSNTVP